MFRDTNCASVENKINMKIKILLNQIINMKMYIRLNVVNNRFVFKHNIRIKTKMNPTEYCCFGNSHPNSETYSLGVRGLRRMVSPRALAKELGSSDQCLAVTILCPADLVQTYSISMDQRRSYYDVAIEYGIHSLNQDYGL